MYASPAERNAQPFPVVAATAVQLPSGPGLHDLVDDDERRSLLASPAFWLGGLASVAAWSGIAALILRWV